MYFLIGNNCILLLYHGRKLTKLDIAAFGLRAPFIRHLKMQLAGLGVELSFNYLLIHAKQRTEWKSNRCTLYQHVKQN